MKPYLGKGCFLGDTLLGVGRSLKQKVTGGIDTHQNLRKWLTYYLKWFFDTEVEEKKLQRNIIMLHHYLKGNNCDYRIINSLQDNLNNIKSKINYVSFIDNEYKGNDKTLFDAISVFCSLIFL